MEDTFRTVTSPAEGYYMDKGSKFIAFISGVISERDVEEFLRHIKKDHPKARHYCWAYRLFEDTLTERLNDDGEPSGTAGKPILGQLLKHDLKNTVVVVVRYFGGTKLGIPGLIEAYRTSAAKAIENAGIRLFTFYTPVTIEMPFDKQPGFMNFCKKNEIKVLGMGMEERLNMTIAFPRSTVMLDLLSALRSYSQMDFENLDRYEKYLDFVIRLEKGTILQ